MYVLYYNITNTRIFIVLFIRRPIFNVCALPNKRECIQVFPELYCEGSRKNGSGEWYLCLLVIRFGCRFLHVEWNVNWPYTSGDGTPYNYFDRPFWVYAYCVILSLCLFLIHFILLYPRDKIPNFYFDRGPLLSNPFRFKNFYFFTYGELPGHICLKLQTLS